MLIALPLFSLMYDIDGTTHRTASVREMRSLQQLQQKQLSDLLIKTELQIEHLEKKKVVELQVLIVVLSNP